MSLKKYKTRIDLIEDDLDHSVLNPFKKCRDWWSSSYLYDEEDEWYIDDYDDFLYYDYDYLPINNLKRNVIRGGKLSDEYLSGRYIDMESIYDKVEKRNRRIDVLLGLNDDKYTPTLGDLIKINKKR